MSRAFFRRHSGRERASADGELSPSFTPRARIAAEPTAAKRLSVQVGLKTALQNVAVLPVILRRAGHSAHIKGHPLLQGQNKERNEGSPLAAKRGRKVL